MAENDGKVKIGVEADSSEFEKGLKNLEGVAKKSFDVIAKGIVTASTALAGGVVAAFKFGSEFESAFAGVKKTVDATEEELAGFERGLRDMAKAMPIAAKDLAGIAEMAGQLGIKNENLMNFTRTMADLGNATNLSGEEAAVAFAQFANITGMDQSNFDRLGSTISE